MTWPFSETNGGPEAKPTDEVKPTEKSPAELIAEALKPFGESFGKLNERLDAIEVSTRKPEPKAQQPDVMSVLDDENVAFAQRLTPLMIRQLELEARVVKGDIKAEYEESGYGELWSQYTKEINNILDTTPVVSTDGKTLRGDPQYIRNVVDMVFGRAAKNAGMRFDGKSKGFFLESAGGSDSSTKPPQNDGLTDDQRKVFGRMKVSLDDAKKVMGKLKFVS